jgi:hypothetical protein
MSAKPVHVGLDFNDFQINNVNRSLSTERKFFLRMAAGGVTAIRKPILRLIKEN